MRKIFANCLFAAGTVLLASGWLDNNFSKRTLVDVDNFRHPAGKSVTLTIDPARLEKACGEKFSAQTVKLGFTDDTGKERELSFATGGVDRVDGKMRLNFSMPLEKGAVHLYFAGKGNAASTEYPDILNGNGANAAKYRSDGFFLAKNIDGAMNLRQKKWTSRENSDVWVEQVFPVKSEYAGIPVTLILDAQSNSKVMWPFSVAIASLDAKWRVIGQRVCDARWSMVQTAPGKPFSQRLEGRIDPRAKYIRIRLVAARAGEKRLFDIYGKPLADKADSLPDITINRLLLVPGYFATLPGANPELYTEGVTPGTSALKLAGKTAPLYNNFTANVWSESSWVRNQDMFFWPLKDEGTAEFYLKLDEVPKKECILIDNGRNNRPSFLRLAYGNGTFKLMMNGYNLHSGKKGGKAKLNTYEFVKSVPYDIVPGKWMHIAITWGKTGVALFADGKKILSNFKTFKPAEFILKKQSPIENISEYTALGADTNRFLNAYRPHTDVYLKGAVDEFRVSKVVRYTDDFIPAKEFAKDADTCALFRYEKNFDGESAVGPQYISGSIHAADAPPRADVFEIEDKNGGKNIVRYVPKEVPDSNVPQYFIRETNYPVLPTPEDFRKARIPGKIQRTVENGGKIEFTLPEHTVPEYVEIKAVKAPVKAPFLRHAGEVDARSFADIANSMDFSDCPTEHAKARKIFDFLVSSTDYFTFTAAAFPRYSNTPMHAAQYGLVAINSYACFQCGPLNGIASGLFTSGLGYPSVLTFGNGHLFQQVMLNGKLRVYDLSAQQYFPSRDQDEAASLDELEKDIYLFQRTRRPVGGASHFFRMSKRGCHSVTNAPRERVEYTLYPGESFRYYPANCGLSNDLNCLNWRGKPQNAFMPTWKNMQKETGSDVEVGRVIQRPLPHTSQGVFMYDGKVKNGAFSRITQESFCYRIDSPYTIISAVYSVPDENAEFELSYDKGSTWRTLESEKGVCKVDYALRGRHVALLKVKTPARTFKAMTFTQLSPRCLTGLPKSGKNTLYFSSDSGSAQVTAAYLKRAGEIVFEGGFYFGAIPGLERQLFTLEPGKSRTVNVSGCSSAATVKASGGLAAKLVNGKLTVTAPADIVKGVKYVVVTDKNAVKTAEFLVCKGVKEFSVKDIKPVKVRKAKEALVLRKADRTRVQDVIKGKAELDVSAVAPGRYVVFTLTRRNNSDASYIQASMWNGSQSLVASRIRNPGFEYYKATYGPFPARWVNRTAEENKIDPWSRFRWDVSTGKDNYPRVSNMPLETVITADNKPLSLAANTECAGVILLPAEDNEFMYLTARNLLNMSRADWIFDRLNNNL